MNYKHDQLMVTSTLAFLWLVIIKPSLCGQKDRLEGERNKYDS
jgi:hypothetical protein